MSLSNFIDDKNDVITRKAPRIFSILMLLF